MICPVDEMVARHVSGGAPLTAKGLLSYQMQMARETIARARKSSRFYAEKLAGVRLSDLADYRDMERIPFTSPADLVSGYKNFLCVPPSQVARIVTLFTSGSTGAPKRLCFTADELKSTEEFFTVGMSQMVQAGERAAIFMDGPAPCSVGDILRQALTNLNVYPQVLGFIRDMPSAIRDADGCHCIIGVPYQVLRLARTAPDLHPKTVLLSADYVPKAVVNAIERSWGAEVYTHYGMTETGFGGGVQCKSHAGYHLRHSDLLIETIDVATGRQAPAGIAGEVVITTLRRTAMPLIRYRTGDMAATVKGPCGCGSTLPRLGKVTGRLTADSTLSIGELDEILYGFDSVLDYEATISGTDSRLMSIVIDAAGSLNTSEVSDAVGKKTRFDGKIEVHSGPIAVYRGPGKRKLLTIN